MKSLLSTSLTISSALLAAALVSACGPSARTDNGDTDTDNTDENCEPIADFETCGGGVDDDCDGDIDCDDADCAEADACQGSGCNFETPTASLFLPDGECGAIDDPGTGPNASTGCESLESPLPFDGFPGGATLVNAGDLISVCASMEHSWIRDLQIELACPNGTTVVLSEYQGQEPVQETLLGQPVDAGLFEEETDEPGVGYDYCWTAGAATSMMDSANAQDPANDPYTLPAGDYATDGDLTAFVGCPLNGEWTMSVQDRWGIDNGFIFSWQINFSETLADDCEID
jgi:hypothetical protein